MRKQVRGDFLFKTEKQINNKLGSPTLDKI